MPIIDLKKDRKLICSVSCSKEPLDLPRVLIIEDFIPKRKTSGLSKLPQFPLTPAPACSRDKDEWGLFLSYLHKHNKVGVGNIKQFKFYILPPANATKCSPVSVAYQMNSPCTVDPESGSHLAEECDGLENSVARGPANGADVCSSDVRFPAVEDHGNHFTAETCPSHVRQDRILEKNFIRAESANSADVKFPPVEDRANRSTAEACSGYPSHVKQDRILEKNFIRADPSYLKTLGQNHSGWVFGGIAELIDNSRDAKATKIDISVDMIKLKKSVTDVPMLSVIDDGHGMNHDEVVKMVSFGHKQLGKDEKDHIGMFGVGFKTGAMRLGRDVLVLTQTAHSRSIAFLSQSLNEGKDNIEIPIVSYKRQGQHMEIDTNVQSEALSKSNLKAIKAFSPFDKYLIGEKQALFRGRPGTQIYIWNLDEWGSQYCLEWHNGLIGGSSFHQGDIYIRSRRSRSRPGQVQKVPLDYSLRAYLEVIFLIPRMKMNVQGTQVNSRPLANFLTKTVIKTGRILGRSVELILGFSQLEWERASCGIFLYWHGRLIEAYKRVGGMIHSVDVGRGVIGVIDVTNLMDDHDGRVWVHNNKQGFQDCESYACLEEWLSRKVDEYWDNNFDSLELDKGNCVCKPDSDWVQCDKCRKWRILPRDFDSRNLPSQWFCYMEPCKGKCTDVEEKLKPGVVVVSAKRSRGDSILNNAGTKKIEADMNASGSGSGSDDKLAKAEDFKPTGLKRLKRGPSKI